MHTENHRTYRISAPLGTHFRVPTPDEVRSGRACTLVGCLPYQNGWRLRWDVLTEQQRHDATHSGRKYVLTQVSELENWLVFEAGQPCFAAPSHRIRVGRPDIFVVRDGAATPRVHTRAEDWRDDMHEHTDRIDTIRQRG